MGLSDRDLLAKTLMAEAGNQGIGGMMDVGSVIMNRANTTGYGNGVRGVIMKPGQFSAWNGTTGYAGGEQGQNVDAMQPSAEIYKAADMLLSGNYNDQTGGATHYYNDAISQPKWGASAGGNWQRRGDHVFGFADAGRRGTSPQPTIGSQAMQVLGKTLPKQQRSGILATPQKGPEPMQQQQPRGLLGSMGIQKMQEGAEGETGQRFYQRDSFKDTAAKMGQAFAALGSNPGVQKFTNDVADQRTETKSRNKTVEYLRANGMGNMADMVEAGDMSAGGVMSAIMQKRLATPKDNRTALQQNYEYAISQGMLPDDARKWVSSGGTTIIDMGEGDRGEFDKADAKVLSSVSEVGMLAQRSLSQIDRLESLLGASPSGAVGQMQLLAGNFGIRSEGLDDLQAATALINTLIPQQRQPGSGPMSDADLDLFKQSLPRIINSPNGNATILQTMRGIAQYDAMGANIVQQFRSGDLTQPQAFAALQARKDPFAQVRQNMQSGAGGAGGGSVLSADDLLYLEGD